MAGLGVASIPFIGCISLLAAIILQILSFASPYWASNSVGSIGLWRQARCLVDSDHDCYRYNFHWNVEDWLDAVRGLECLAIIFMAIPLMVLPVYMAIALGLYYRCIMGSMTALTLLATLCNVVGVIVYGAKIAENELWSVQWCLIVCIIAGAFAFIAFLIFLVGTINKPMFLPSKFYPSGFYVDPDRNKLYVVENIERPEDIKEVPLDGHNPVIVAQN